VPILRNYFFSALAGTTWYFQFFFYTMGETQMGKFGFASWTLHMASIIIFSTMWGWILHEWKGSSKKAHGLIAAGIATLILSTVIIGYGTYLKGRRTKPRPRRHPMNRPATAGFWSAAVLCRLVFDRTRPKAAEDCRTPRRCREPVCASSVHGR